jgi:hypothetical protein
LEDDQDLELVKTQYNETFFRRVSYIAFSIYSQAIYVNSHNPPTKGIIDQLNYLEDCQKFTTKGALSELINSMKKLGIWVSIEDLKLLV